MQEASNWRIDPERSVRILSIVKRLKLNLKTYPAIMDHILDEFIARHEAPTVPQIQMSKRDQATGAELGRIAAERKLSIEELNRRLLVPSGLKYCADPETLQSFRDYIAKYK